MGVLTELFRRKALQAEVAKQRDYESFIVEVLDGDHENEESASWILEVLNENNWDVDTFEQDFQRETQRRQVKAKLAEAEQRLAEATAARAEYIKLDIETRAKIDKLRAKLKEQRETGPLAIGVMVETFSHQVSGFRHQLEQLQSPSQRQRLEELRKRIKEIGIEMGELRVMDGLDAAELARRLAPLEREIGPLKEELQKLGQQIMG